MTNIVIIIRRPDYGGEDKRRPRVILACERSDNYKSCKSSETTDTGYVCARLNCQQLQLFSFNCKSIPKFNFGRVLIYFKP
ncbi:unnamed protein product [Prunus brigantina]